MGVVISEGKKSSEEESAFDESDDISISLRIAVVNMRQNSSKNSTALFESVDYDVPAIGILILPVLF
jgi:hypothetical protein